MSRYETVAAKYRPIFDRIAAGALDRERTRTLPHEQIGWLTEAGFGAARIPVELGGDGLSWPEYSRLLVELAAADSNLPQALRGHVALVEDQLYHHPADDRSRWLRRFAAGEIAGNAWTEPGQGGVATTLAGSGGTLRLTGRKYYTTGTIFADWIDATAQREDGSDVAVIVSTRDPGVTTSDDWDGFGQRLTGSGTTVFDGAAVDAADVFDFASRFPYQTALYQHLLLITLAGIATAVEREAADQVRARTRNFSTANASLVRHDPQVLQVIGEISAKAYVARAAVQEVAVSLERAYESRSADAATAEEATVEAELASARAQVVLSTLVPDAATALFDALGASSTSEAKALDRFWRNARTVATHNPFVFKARIVGDWVVNRTPPPFVWSIGVQPGAAAGAVAG